jgi:tetratricopeptide (TPR) repeat protein
MTQRLSEFVSLAHQLIRERTAARPIVEKVQRNPFAFLGRELPPEWRTAGMAEQLTAAAVELLAQAPDKSAALARLAIAVAGELDGYYPHIVRAQVTAAAWKELANAHRYRSEYDEALNALDRADAVIQDEPSLAYDNAVLALARATTLRELDRIPEALELLQHAMAVFRGHGDETRVAQCDLLAGMIRHGQGDAAAARSAYHRALEVARGIGHAQIVASVYVNLGVLDAERGRTNDALDSLQQARAIFIELGAHGEIARARWGIGMALLNASKYEAAIPLLRDAREDFRELAMIEEAGLAGIELVEAHLALDRTDAAREILAVVIDELRGASLSEHALVALAYLRDLGPAVRRESAHHVYAYLLRLRREPALLFQPPD